MTTQFLNRLRKNSKYGNIYAQKVDDIKAPQLIKLNKVDPISGLTKAAFSYPLEKSAIYSLLLVLN